MARIGGVAVPKWLVILVLWIPMAAADASAEGRQIWQFSSGNWVGGAWASEEGSFSYCAVSSSFVSGIQLAFAITADYELEIALGRDDWDLPPGEVYTVSLFVDRKPLGSFEATPTRGDVLLIHIGPRADVLRSLRMGYLFHVDAAKDDFYFDLSGSNQALEKTLECVRLRTALSSDPRNPFAEGEGEANPFAPRGEEREARVAIEQLLNAAGLDDVVFVQPAAVGLDDASVAWVASGGVIGGLIVVEGPGLDVDQAMGIFVGSAGAGCRGRFASGSSPSRSHPNGRIKRLSGACEGPEGNLYFVATGVTNPKGLFIFLNGSDGGLGDLTLVNAELERVMLELLQ
jgi:hypothetical protein